MFKFLGAKEEIIDSGEKNGEITFTSYTIPDFIAMIRKVTNSWKGGYFWAWVAHSLESGELKDIIWI